MMSFAFCFLTFVLTSLAPHRVRLFFLLRFRRAHSFLFGLLILHPKMSFHQCLSGTKRGVPSFAPSSRHNQAPTIINVSPPLAKKTKVHCSAAASLESFPCHCPDRSAALPCSKATARVPMLVNARPPLTKKTKVQHHTAASPELFCCHHPDRSTPLPCTKATASMSPSDMKRVLLPNNLQVMISVLLEWIQSLCSSQYHMCSLPFCDVTKMLLKSKIALILSKMLPPLASLI